MEHTITEEKESSSVFDIKKFISKLSKNYYWFIITISLFCAGAFLYMRYTLPLYNFSTYVLIKKPSDGKAVLGGSPFSAAHDVSDPTAEMGNEILKFKSVDVVGYVVDSLGLEVELSRDGRLKNQPVNRDSLPFKVIIKKATVENESPLYKLTLNRANYQLESDLNKIVGLYNQPLVINSDTLIIQVEDLFNIKPNSEYQFHYLSRSGAISKYISRVSVIPVPKIGPGLFQVSLMDEFPERAKMIINTLVHSYDLANLRYNNQAIRAEMDFLNKRIAVVSAELDSQARLVRDFKAGNKIFDVSSSASQLLNTLPSLDSRKSEYVLKNKLLSLVENNVGSFNGKEEIIPNSSGLQDPVLTDQINKYNQLVLQKRAVLDRGTAQDPRLQSINGQMQEVRKNIQKNIKNIRNEIDANFSSIAQQKQSITGKFTSMPSKEKQLIELNRILEIKQSLYTFLLQRREDKNIQLASSEIVNSRIVDNGQSGFTKMPPPQKIYGVALVAGILLPIVVILLRVLLNNKIETRQDIESASSIIIAGEIGKVGKRAQEIVVTPKSSLPQAEQFRTLRTNISYLSQGLSNKTILITSSKSAEGKSFISLNLANSIAISGRRVALLEFDLRNPGLSKKIGIHETLGISNYLRGEIDIDEVIQTVNESENLFFISSGMPLSTDVGDLIMNDRMEQLFVYLKHNFDVIVIDTPPVGPVSDALTLGKWADISFFIIRHKYTLRSSLKLVNKLNEGRKLPQLALIINGIQDNREFNYGNDYGYGYGYQAESKKKKRLSWT